MEKSYICECGKQFTNSQSFNGHKGHCKEHQIAKYGFDHYNKNLELQFLHRNKATATHKLNCNNVSQQKLAQWLLERHRCERCGKTMTEQFGSGRFCSRACANAHKHSDESKAKASKSLSGRSRPLLAQQYSKLFEEKYKVNPNYCIVCGKPIPYKSRKRKTCSDQCWHKKLSLNIQNTRENIGLFNICSKYKYGTYKGIHCDSSWELAFVLYCLDHNINFNRNTKDAFTYTYEGNSHLYYPDFIIGDTYIEIKGLYTDEAEAKKQCFPLDKRLIILGKAELQPCLEYAKQVYGTQYYNIYDRTQSSWLDTIAKT